MHPYSFVPQTAKKGQILFDNVLLQHCWVFDIQTHLPSMACTESFV